MHSDQTLWIQRHFCISYFKIHNSQKRTKRKGDSALIVQEIMTQIQNLSLSLVVIKKIKDFQVLKKKKLNEKLKCVSQTISKQMLSALSEYFILFILLNIFVKSLWYHSACLFRWNCTFSVTGNGSSRIFQSSLWRLKGYALWQVAHHGSFIMQRRKVGLETVHHLTIILLFKSLCMSFDESINGCHGCDGELCSGQDDSKSQTKPPCAKCVYRFSCLRSAILP